MADLPDELTQALESDDSGLLAQIVEQGEPELFQALQSLLETSEDVNPDYRRKALWALGRWGNAEPVSQIRRIMPQLPEVERIAAVDALGRIGTPEALDGVIAAADDDSYDVQRYVVRALGRIDSAPAQDQLRKLETQASHPDIRQMAARQLGKKQ